MRTTCNASCIVATRGSSVGMWGYASMTIGVSISVSVLINGWLCIIINYTMNMHVESKTNWLCDCLLLSYCMNTKIVSYGDLGT